MFVFILSKKRTEIIRRELRPVLKGKSTELSCKNSYAFHRKKFAGCQALFVERYLCSSVGYSYWMAYDKMRRPSNSHMLTDPAMKGRCAHEEGSKLSISFLFCHTHNNSCQITAFMLTLSSWSARVRNSCMWETLTHSLHTHICIWHARY